MLIIGAKGHAVEVLQCLTSTEHYNLIFYDDVNEHTVKVFDNFTVCKSMDAAAQHFTYDSRFILGLGNPLLRRRIASKFSEIGGVLTSVIASSAQVSPFSQLSAGLNIMHFCLVAPNAVIGMGTLLNTGSTVHHDVRIGEFCEVSPGAHILGRCQIGVNVSIGAGAVVLPDIEIGDNSIVGAGAVVTRNLPPHSKVVGVPARSLN